MLAREPSMYIFREAGKGWVVIKDEFIVVPSFLSRQKINRTNPPEGEDKCGLRNGIMVASLRWYYPDQVQRVRSALATLSATVGSPSSLVDQHTRWIFRLS